jgi:N-acetylglucosaminyl-diphospho-decaprenol L-rhamnosyltransferase
LQWAQCTEAESHLMSRERSPIEPHHSSPTVDVVVVAYNSRETLRACVEPLAQLPWVRVTVVDNASPDDSASTVADLDVKVITAPRNGGFAYGCNLGMADGAGEFVLLLNPDARIDRESLLTLVDTLRGDPGLAGVGPRTVDESGHLAFSQRRFPRLRSTFAQVFFLHRVAPRATWSDDVIRDAASYQRAGRADWLSGCCLLMRRDALEDVGGLDEGFFLYSEETDLFRRLAAAGWRAGYEPRATAHHVGGVSADRLVMKPVWAQSRVRYARKHHGPMVGLLEAVGVALWSVTHAMVWIHRPSDARRQLATGRAALQAVRTSKTSLP